MSSNSSGRKLEGFFTGKGFYIVLFLCAAVIGVSSWMMAAGNGTMSEEPVEFTDSRIDGRVETIIVAPEESPIVQTVIAEETVTDSQEENENTALTPEEESIETVEVFGGTEESMESAAMSAGAESEWIWPVSGSVERYHDPSTLKYDVTMRDWRTHEGIDILAPLGSTVCASRGGVVESIVNDDLYGTVVTIDHGDGSRAIYANLADMPAVATGSSVQPGYIIGAVGTTAICEIGQGTHLHFAVTVNGESVDPLDHLG